ncbi:MAG: DNA alkylation repair protein [Eubacteriales bacterium]|nr:DNA alkylation repair protein [Eubacteriales bacterium]MDD4541934.1 DNA alkylation repair protein [Eubacteriales bacterium]
MDKFSAIKCRFEAHSDKEKAAGMARYMRDQFIFYGLQAAARRAQYQDVLRAEKKQGEIDWDFLNLCYADEHREFQYLAVDYLSELKHVLRYADVSKLKGYIQTKSWWDTVDGLDQIAGSIGLHDGRIDTLMLEWSLDEDFWLRRVAINHQRDRKEKTDTELLAQIICNNLGSDEFFINKAIGWSLREYSKTDPDWVRDFINQNREQMAKLSIREGSKYI